MVTKGKMTGVKILVNMSLPLPLILPITLMRQMQMGTGTWTCFPPLLMMIPLPQDFFAGQMFLSPSKEKVYVTSRGKSELYTFGLDQFPYRLKKIILWVFLVQMDVVKLHPLA